MSGCQGPSTKVLPRNEAADVFGVPGNDSKLQEANVYFLQESLNRLSKEPRGPNSEGAADTREFLEWLLCDYRYSVTIDEDLVLAEQKTEEPDSDILLLVTNYGSAAGTAGAYDNASGTAALLETARLLAGVETDTELRFVFLPGTRDMAEGIRRYVSRMDSSEGARLLGAVQIGPVGLSYAKELYLGTEDGSPTFLGDQLRQKLIQSGREIPDYIAEERTIQNVLMRAQIPVVYLSELPKAYEQGTPLDDISLVDVERLADAVNLLSETVYELMKPETLSMQAKAHFLNRIRDEAFVQGKEAVLPFGKNRTALERITGQEGTLYLKSTDAEGRNLSVYRYPMKWFGVDQILMTDYYYFDGALTEVRLDADGAGVDLEDVLERITLVYGEASVKEVSGEGRYEWILPELRLNIRIYPVPEGYQLSFQEYDTERRLLEPESLGADKLEKLIRALWPDEELARVSFEFYTDGMGKTKGYLEPGNRVEEPETDSESEEPEGPAYALGLDLNDALTPEGEWRNRNDTVFTILELYGEYLMLKDPALYSEPFEERFSLQPGFAKSFAWFVLTGPPGSQSGEWGEKISFFYDYLELMNYKDEVRKTSTIRQRN